VSAALSLILIVGAAYLAAHVLFEWLADRYRIVSGAEYLILGILLGPQVSGFMSADVVTSFAPFMTLALGWTGAALGMNFYLPRLMRVPAHTFTVALLEAILTFLVVSAVMVVAFSWAFDLTYRQVILPALSLGAIATAAASSAVALLSPGTPHPVVEQLEMTALIDGAFAITAFGILLCVVHIDVSIGPRALTPTEWAVITIGIGVIGGTLFHLFLGPERNPDRLFIAMAGAIILASGAAAYLRLSPLLPAMIIGAILVNTSTSRDDLQRMMNAVEKPLYFVLLLFAGAAWKPSRLHWVLPVILYVFLRMAAKLGSARLAARLLGSKELRQSNWGRGLLGQGILALAIALSYSLNDMTIVPNVVLTAAIATVIVTDIFGVRIVTAMIAEEWPSLFHPRRRKPTEPTVS
jgi:Kef-type K+ transport system membrane component KefB